MRLRLLFLLCLLLASSSAQADQPNGCPDYEPPTVNVRQLIVAPRHNDTFDLLGIRQLAEQGGQEITSKQHETPIGLTAASLKLDSQYDIKIKSRSDDVMVCAQISNFTLAFGFDDTIVFVAREIPYGSCGYRSVLEHEMKHVQTDRIFVDATVPVLGDYIKKALGQIGVIRASSPEAAEAHIKKMMSEYMQSLGANLSQVRKKQQLMIDTPEEYERISASCDGELGKIIRNARGLNPYR
jgi:hypothetical protein